MKDDKLNWTFTYVYVKYHVAQPTTKMIIQKAAKSPVHITRRTTQITSAVNGISRPIPDVTIPIKNDKCHKIDNIHSMNVDHPAVYVEDFRTEGSHDSLTFYNALTSNGNYFERYLSQGGVT